MPRPAPRFRDFVGQKRVVDLLRRQLVGAQGHNEPFPHALFHGPSGVGKTRLAQALAAELGTAVVEARGYDNKLTLSDKLSRLRDHDILLVDEAHRLGHAEQELMTEAIDLGTIPAPASKPAGPPGGPAGREDGRVAIRPWTLVLATDQPGLLLDALYKRIVIEIALDHYPLNELKEIVAAMASQVNVLLSPQAARLVAESSSGLPRRAKQLLHGLRLFHPHSRDRQLELSEVREFLDARGCDATGLNQMECRYLEAVARLGAGSLESIAQALGSDHAFVRRQIEPALLRRGLVRIKPAGRQLTDSGREWAKGRFDGDKSRQAVD
jgi:holliday junction DNA helicase RuvB